jgi:hypothetical protein
MVRKPPFKSAAEHEIFETSEGGRRTNGRCQTLTRQGMVNPQLAEIREARAGEESLRLRRLERRPVPVTNVQTIKSVEGW